MKHRFAWSLLLALAFAIGLLAWLTPSAQSEGNRAPKATRYVAPDGSDPGNNCSVTPCLTIGRAISESVYGDQISVASGWYTEHITMKNGVSIYGQGWFSTIITGNFSLAQPVVAFPPGIGATTVLSGVQVSGGGNGDPLTSPSGGGIQIVNGSPTIVNTWVYSNTGNSGGGIYVGGGSPTFNNVPVWSSRALYGGGIYLYGTTVTMTGDLLGNTFTVLGNSASYEGGGIHMSGVTATLSGLHINWNTAQQYGGGVRIVNSPNRVALQSNEIAHNSASVTGGGISAQNSTNLQIAENWINSNFGANAGGGAQFSQAAGLFKSNVLSGNTVGSYGTGGGVYLGMTSTITLDWNWLELNTSPVEGGGLHVTTGASALINGNVFITNTANNYGGGVNVHPSAGVVTLTNNIAAHNSVTDTNHHGTGFYLQGGAHRVVNNTVADNMGTGITFGSASGIQIYNNIVFGNFNAGLERLDSSSYNADYNDFASNGVDYLSVGTGMHDKAYDPLFVGTGNRRDYYHIQAASPVRNLGSLAWAPLKDIDGDIRLFGGSVSMGADEIPSSGYTLTLPVILK